MGRVTFNCILGIVCPPPVLTGGVDMSPKTARLGGWENPVKAGGELKAGGVCLRLGGL